MSKDLNTYFKSNKWNIKSVFGWQMIFAPIVVIIASILFLYLIIQYKREIIHYNYPIDILEMFVVGTVGICTFLSIIFYTKSIAYENDIIIVNYIFRNKTYSYQIHDVIGCWSELYTTSGTGGKYANADFVLCFKTSDNRVYILKDYQYSNFWELQTILLDKIGKKEMKTYSNRKLISNLLIFFIAISSTILILWEVLK